MTFRKIRCSAFAAAMLFALASSPPALAPVFAQQTKPSPKGDWTGDLVTLQLTCKLGIHTNVLRERRDYPAQQEKGNVP